MRSFSNSFDGLGFLTSVLGKVHPNLCDTIGSTSITDKIRLPEFTDDINFFEFLEQVIQYFKDNPRSHLIHSTYVKEQMSLDGRFGVALNALILELNKHSDGTGYLPPELRLENLGDFVTQRLTDPEIIQIAHPRNKPSISVNKGNTARRKFKVTDAPSQNDSRDTNENQTKFCKACGQYGHDIDECRVCGKHIHLQQWLDRLSDDKRRDFLVMYRNDRKKAHENYLSNLYARKSLKKKVRALYFESYMSCPQSSTVVRHSFPCMHSRTEDQR